MLWAFFSDIHGNRRALDRIEDVCSDRRVGRSVCLGDVIGRGDPEGCVAWVGAHAAIAVAGNRDFDHIDLVRPELREIVARWPREAADSNFIVTHGDPGGHWLLRSNVEVKSFRGVSEYLSERAANIWLYGHTHYARVWRLDKFGDPLSSSRIELEPNGLYVVNVGTTGRPFPGKGGASMVLYEDAEGWLETVDLPK